MARYTEAQKRATLKYQAERAQLKITVTKEQRDRYQKMAEEAGMSLTQYIIKKMEE